MVDEAAGGDPATGGTDVPSGADLSRDFFERLPAVFYAGLPNGLGRFAFSPHAEVLFGFSLGELGGSPEFWLSRVHSDDRDRVVADIQQSARAARPARCDYRMLDRRGEAVWVRDEWVWRQGSAPGELAPFGMLTDLTAEKRVEEQLRQSEKVRALGLLAGGIAHDFGNFLMVVKGYTTLALEQADDPVMVRRSLDEILRVTQKAASVTRQLLSFSRTQSMALRPLDLNSVIVDVKGLLEKLLGETITIAARLAEGIGTVRVDAADFWQILLNLVLNARDAMPAGGSILLETAPVEIPEKDLEEWPGVRPGDWVRLSVSDTGSGMHPETAERAFEAFFSTKPRGSGTGLGLTRVREIVERSGGRAVLLSTQGKGTRVDLLLPRVDEAKPQGSGEIEPSSSADKPDETILLVEDEDDVREVVRRDLQAAGYHVLEAPTAERAILIAEHFQAAIHLLVADVVLPQGSGCDVHRRTTALRPGTKVLFISGYPRGDLVPYGLDAAAPFLQKPFSPATLVSKVREALKG